MRALQEHFSRGRIDIHEYDERVSEAMSARTANELGSLFEDLPGPHPLAPPVAFVPPMPQPAPAPPGSAHPGSAHPGSAHLGSQPEFPPQYQASDKSKLAAGLLQIFLPFGVGRFYTGHTGTAVGQLLLFWVGLLPCGLGTLAALVWCVIDGIVILSGPSTDAFGRQLRD